MGQIFRRVLALALLLAGLQAAVAEPCRIAYDLGSSGIRVGASNRPGSAQTDIDFLSPLWAGHGLDEVIQPTIKALNELPTQADLPGDCIRVAAGFSAWRLALQQDRQALVRHLRTLWQQTGTAIIVAPQVVEGRYGYTGAKLALGGRLKTTHILDIGGGSLQLASADKSFGLALGQKAWHRLLCQTLRPGTKLPCTLLPMTPDELSQARAMAAKQFAGLPATLGKVGSITAISRPVTRGVVPAMEKLLLPSQGEELLSSSQLTRFLTLLAASKPEDAARQLGIAPKYVAYLISDAVLLESILRSADVQQFAAMEGDQSNIPGLLHDEQAFAWAAAYPCYLGHLQHIGLGAYGLSPQGCLKKRRRPFP